MVKNTSFSADTADAIALEALSFLASDPETLDSFCNETGLLLNDLKTRLNDRVVLGGVLDYIMADQQRMKLFCASAGYNPEVLVKARVTMPGFSPEMRTVENF